MTKEEAIDIIKSECYVFNPLNFDRSTMVNTALDMAIKALEPCEDCISRSEALKVIEEQKQGFYGVERYAIDEAHSAVMKLPSVTPQPKTGHWIDIMVGDMPAQACDRCNTFYPLAYTGGGHKYCPNCGARMEVET